MLTKLFQNYDFFKFISQAKPEGSAGIFYKHKHTKTKCEISIQILIRAFVEINIYLDTIIKPFENF